MGDVIFVIVNVQSSELFPLLYLFEASLLASLCFSFRLSTGEQRNTFSKSGLGPFIVFPQVLSLRLAEQMANICKCLIIMNYNEQNLPH